MACIGTFSYGRIATMALYSFSVEPAMFFLVGFLVAALIGIIFIPPDWRARLHARAVRQNGRRVEAAARAMTDILSHRDQLRADFAVAEQQLKAHVEHVKKGSARKSRAIKRLKAEIVDLRSRKKMTVSAHAPSRRVQARDRWHGGRQGTTNPIAVAKSRPVRS